MPDRDRILLGQFGAAHGIRGEVRLKSFTEDPADIAAYGPLALDDGRVVEILSVRPQGEMLVARVKGVGDRNAAETLTNRKLLIDRAALPALDEEDDFYQADLVGLRAELGDGTAFGTVVGIADFGAGDLVEIAPAAGGQTVFLPFTRAVVPTVDIAGGRLVVAPPAELPDEGEGEDGPDEAGA